MTTIFEEEYDRTLVIVDNIGTQGPAGPQGPQGPPGDPGDIAFPDLIDVDDAINPAVGDVPVWNGEFWSAAAVNGASGIGTPSNGLVVSAGTAPRGPLYAFDDFSLHDDGPLHGAETNGGAMGDPLTWADFRVLAGGFADAYIEQAQIVDGALRHRGTLPLVVVVHEGLPEAAREHGCAVTMGVADDTEGGGDDGESSARIGFASLSSGNGYVAYLTSPGPTDDHVVQIVRDDAFEPTYLGGPWSVGRRLGSGDCWTFAADGQGTYVVLVNGTEVGRVTNTDHDWADIDSTAITLTTDGEWLPGVAWWALNTGNFVPELIRTVDEVVIAPITLPNLPGAGEKLYPSNPTIDGQKLLLRSQNSSSENGIYDVVNGELVRAESQPKDGELIAVDTLVGGRLLLLSIVHNDSYLFNFITTGGHDNAGRIPYLGGPLDLTVIQHVITDPIDLSSNLSTINLWSHGYSGSPNYIDILLVAQADPSENGIYRTRENLQTIQLSPQNSPALYLVADEDSSANGQIWYGTKGASFEMINGPGPQGDPGDTPLSDDAPEPLGSANPGTSDEASRSDHVHPLPTPGDIGAAEDSHDHDGVYQPQSSTLTALAELILSGSPGSTTFLRGDGAWSPLPLQLVAQTVTSANAMTVQLTGLEPYKFLVLMTSARGTESGTATTRQLWAQFNGDTGTNYNSTTSTGQTGIAVQHLPTTDYGWGSVGLCLIDNTAAGVTKHLVGVGLVGATQNAQVRGGLWMNTTDLISTIELSGTGSNEIAAGASFVLLGVPR